MSYIAFCPKCGDEVKAAAAACPHCGYIFPVPEKDRRDGLAYSRLADSALFLAKIATELGCLVVPLAVIAALVQENPVAAFVLCPLAFLFQFALWVVFVRVQHL